jgi:Effector-associated domain 7/TIR domain
MTQLGAKSIFICYRRSDSADTADRIYESLAKEFGPRAVFRDIDSIPPGVDFRSRIGQELESCRVVLVVIGPDWLLAKSPSGGRRLEESGDDVRAEIEAALSRPDLIVIPILVREAWMPEPDEIPQEIRPLAGLNGLSIRPNPDFPNDLSRLVKILREAIPKNPDDTSGQAEAWHGLDLAVLRRLIEEAFTDEDLRTFCFDHFREVESQFTSGQTKGQRVLSLIRYAETRSQLPKLIEAIRRARPETFRKFEPHAIRLTMSNPGVA